MNEALLQDQFFYNATVLPVCRTIIGKFRISTSGAILGIPQDRKLSLVPVFALRQPYIVLLYIFYASYQIYFYVQNG